MVVNWNFWSKNKFAYMAQQLGVQSCKFNDFEIHIDLPKVDTDFKTYTEKLEDGRRLQITGGILLNWKFIIIKK